MKSKGKNLFLITCFSLLACILFCLSYFLPVKGETSPDVNLDFSENADSYFAAEYQGWKTDTQTEKLVPNYAWAAMRYNTQLDPNANFKLSFDYSLPTGNDQLKIGLFSIADNNVSYSEGYSIISAASGDLLFGTNNAGWNENHKAGPKNDVNMKEGEHCIEFIVWNKTLTIKFDHNYWYGSQDSQPALDADTQPGYFKFQLGNTTDAWLDNFKVETLTENPYEEEILLDIDLDFSENADSYFSAEYLGWTTANGKLIPKGPYGAMRYNAKLNPEANFKISFDYFIPQGNDMLFLGLFSIADDSGNVSYSEGYGISSTAQSGDLLYGPNNNKWSVNHIAGPKNDVNMKEGEHSVDIIVWNGTLTIRLDKQFWYGSNESQPALDANTQKGYFKFQTGSQTDSWLDNFKVETLTQNPYPIYDLEGFKQAKTRELEEYVAAKNSSDYTTENWQKVQTLLAEGKTNIAEAISEDAVLQAYDNTVNAINAIPAKFDCSFDFSDGKIPTSLKGVTGTFEVSKDGNKYLTSATNWNVLVYDKAMDDFKLEFDFRKPIGSNNLVINFCVQTNDGTFNKGYTFMIGSSGMTVNLDGNSGSQIWKMSGNKGYVDGKWHHVTIYHVEDKISVLFDDVPFEVNTVDTSVKYESGVWIDSTYSQGYVTIATDGAIDIDNFKTSAQEFFPASVVKSSAFGNFDAAKLENLPENWQVDKTEIINTEFGKNIVVHSGGRIDFVPEQVADLYNFSIQIKSNGKIADNGVIRILFRTSGENGYCLEIKSNGTLLKEMNTDAVLAQTDSNLLAAKQLLTLTANGNLLSLYARNEKILEIENTSYFYGGLILESENTDFNMQSLTISSPVVIEEETENGDVSYLPEGDKDIFEPSSKGCSQNISGDMVLASVITILAAFIVLLKKKTKRGGKNI